MLQQWYRPLKADLLSRMPLFLHWCRGSLKWLWSSFRHPNPNWIWDQLSLNFFISELAELYEELPEYIKSGRSSGTGTFFMSILSSMYKSFLVVCRGLYLRYWLKRKKYVTVNIGFSEWQLELVKHIRLTSPPPPKKKKAQFQSPVLEVSWDACFSLLILQGLKWLAQM